MGTIHTSLFIPGVFGIQVPPIITIASLSSLPGEKRWHALVPSAAYRWAKKKGEGWLIFVTFIGVVLVAGLLVGTWILECLASPLTASPSRFLSPSKNHVSRRHRVDCAHLADVSQQGPQSPSTRELVTGDPMACSIRGRPRKCPSGFIAHRQTWQLLPGLKHGYVESIVQLTWYHAQFNTPMEWRRQFCSGETRFDQYAVHPERLAFRFSKPKKQSCPVEYLSFLVCIILDLIRWYPICHAFYHRIEGISPPVFQFPPLTSKGI